MAKLSAGYRALALSMQEAATDLTSRDVCSRLSDAIRDQFRGGSSWAYFIDYIGDAESGDVIYTQDGDTKKASYSITGGDGAAKCVIDFENAEDVTARTIYEPEQDEEAHYAQMAESFIAAKMYTELPLYERFISKAERDKADSEDFAGNGKSFPILKPEDVSAAARSIGRAGSGNKGPSAIKAAIIRIAKRKGWEKYLPKAWQGGDSKEAAVPRETAGSLKLAESQDWTNDVLSMIESAGSVRMPIKIIAPGKGSSAHYPAEVLKRDGPGVFTKGTHIYINHATKAEESQRPEGDWHKLAGALESNAYYDEAGKKGPGLYADALFTSDYAPLLKEKAPFTGMSIRASGEALMEAGKQKLQDGLPILSKLTRAESVDVVTRPGAGGMILTESQRNNGDEMTKDEIIAIVQEAVKAVAPKPDEAAAKTLKTLEARALRGDATVEATRVLSGLTGFTEAMKQRVISTVLERDLPLKDGILDVAKFGELVTAEAKREGEYVAALTGNGKVRGMGIVPATTQVTAEEAARQVKAREAQLADDTDLFKALGLDEKQAKAVANQFTEAA